jgi:dolichyl-phosphate-mannose-protein mannosyltransferase
MISLASISTLRAPGFTLLARLVDELSDPARRYRAALGFALIYAITWALYATIAKSSQGINADMGEALIWMREPALGYPKHPPFIAWELMAWFAVFPLSDWSYYLLAAVNLAGGLLAAFLLAGEWLEAEKRAAVLFLLAVIPFYNFLGLKFDQNSILIPLWALTIWAFVRSLATLYWGYAVLAGLLGAASLLSKYWSIFLLMSIGLAALLDRRRNVYFSSPAPYLMALVTAVAMAPHAYWLIREQFPPLTWVTTRRLSQSLLDALQSLTEYSAGTLGYASAAIVLVMLFVRPSRRGICDGLLGQRADDRRTAAILFWAPMLLPILVAFVTHTNLLSLWNTPALNLLPVVLLGSPLVSVTREQVAQIAGVAITVSLVALLVSPIVSFALFRTGVENHAIYSRSLAAALEREWARSTDRPLRLVAGPAPLVDSLVMYLPDRPSTFADFSTYLSPWVNQRRVERDGVAIACPFDELWCIDRMKALATDQPGAQTLDLDVTPSWFGLAGPSQRFAVTIVTPRNSLPSPGGN